jgi:predicted nucleic acid-binding protein
MSFLLDTNICSAHIRRPAGLAHRFIQHSGRIWIPTVDLGELYAGAYMAPAAGVGRILSCIADLLPDVQLLPFDADAAEEFGKLSGDLKQRGFAVGPRDLQIAATALANGLILVTNNTSDFQHIPGLQLEDWLTP